MEALWTTVGKVDSRGEKHLWEWLAAPDHTVPCGTVLSRDAFPGTSCQATIGVVPTGRASNIRNSIQRVRILQLLNSCNS
jgi:hypothetical protein